jgi:hypothetical protein
MPLNTLSQIFNTTAIKAIPNQNNNLLDFVGISGTTVASVTSGGVLDLRASSGTILGDSSSVIGNKIQLWANSFGIGIQNGRLVLYNDSGSATSIRTSLTGSDIIRFNNDGNLSTRYVDSLANSGAYLDLGVGTAGIIAVNRNAGHIPLTIRGAISQSVSIQEWQNSSGTPLASVSSSGAISGTSFNSITGLSSTTPVVDGTAAVGTATTTARADHVHPTDTSRAATSGTLAQFAATTSAQLAGVISDETGSGALVFATSPTLTTPSIGVATGTSFNSITGLSSTTPAVNGTAAVGTATTTARADHVHPISALTIGTGLSGTSYNGSSAVTIANSGVLSVNGSTGAVTGIATSGANSNITSLTGLTTALSATQGGTAQSTYATGDIVYASASNTLSKRTIGSTGQVLTVSAGVPTWSNASSGANEIMVIMGAY